MLTIKLETIEGAKRLTGIVANMVAALCGVISRLFIFWRRTLRGAAAPEEAARSQSNTLVE